MRFFPSILLLSCISSFGALTQEEHNLLYDIEANTDATSSRLSEVNADMTTIIGYLNAQSSDIVDICLDVGYIRSDLLPDIYSILSSLNTSQSTATTHLNALRANVQQIWSDVSTTKNYASYIQDDTAFMRSDLHHLLEMMWSNVGSSSNIVSLLESTKDILSSFSSNSVSSSIVSTNIFTSSTNFFSWVQEHFSDSFNANTNFYYVVSNALSSISNYPAASSSPFDITNFVANYIFPDLWQTMWNQSAPATAGENSIWETLSLVGSSMNPYQNGMSGGDALKLFPSWVLNPIPGGNGWVTPSMYIGSNSPLWPEMQQLQFYYLVSNSSAFASFDPRRPLPSGSERRHWVNMWGDYNYFTGNPLTGSSLRSTNKGYLFSDWLADFLKMSASTNTERSVATLSTLDSIYSSSSNILENVSTNGFGESVDFITNSWEEVEEFQPPTLWELPEWSNEAGTVFRTFNNMAKSYKEWSESGLVLNVNSNQAISTDLVIIPAMTRFGISEHIFNFNSSLPRVCSVVHTVLGMLWTFVGVVLGLHITAHNLREVVKAC